MIMGGFYGRAFGSILLRVILFDWGLCFTWC
jgi:hypothetical protein